MENEYKVYDGSGKFLAAYGLGWSLTDIFNAGRTTCGRIANALHDDGKAETVALVVGGREVNRITRSELKEII